MTLPLDQWRQIYPVAKAGEQNTRRKKPGKSPGRPVLTRSDDLAQAAVVEYARKCKANLDAEAKRTGTRRPKTGNNSTQDEAAEKTRAFAYERYGLRLSVNTIKDMMGRAQQVWISDPEPDF